MKHPRLGTALSASLAVLALGAAGCGSSSSSSSAAPAPTPSATQTTSQGTPPKAGVTPHGTAAPLRAGQFCSSAKQHTYAAHHFRCVNGRLKKVTASSSGSSGSSGGAAVGGSGNSSGGAAVPGY